MSARENVLQARSRGRLAIISRPGTKRLQLEIAFRSRNESQRLVEELGGRVEKLPRDWLKRFARAQKSKPLKIGKRLVISTKAYSQITPAAGNPPLLVIPRGMAFGTGEHATTAMSLRLLERLTRGWKHSWSLADLGTGSGILALAAERFGAGRVVGIDIDPKAISVAKANARLNKIDNVDFKLGDLRKWRSRAGWDIVAANLYSQLLIEIFSKSKRANWLILSGVLRTQENEFLRVLRKNSVGIVKVNRRGKWIAILARKRRASNAQRPPFNHS